MKKQFKEEISIFLIKKQYEQAIDLYLKQNLFIIFLFFIRVVTYIE